VFAIAVIVTMPWGGLGDWARSATAAMQHGDHDASVDGHPQLRSA